LCFFILSAEPGEYRVSALSGDAKNFASVPAALNHSTAELKPSPLREFSHNFPAKICSILAVAVIIRMTDPSFVGAAF
jgi:hypothetical protein